MVGYGLGCLVALHGCSSANGQAPAGGRPVPSWLARQVPPPPRPSAPAVEPVSAMAVSPSLPVFDPAQIVALLDEPRLGEVKRAVLAEAPKRAADALEELLRKSPPPPAEEPAWQLQLGLLRKSAGDPGSAVRAFDAAASTPWELSDYARWLAADLLVQTGEPAQAKKRLEPVAPGGAIDDEVMLVRAAALAGTGEVDAAATIWKSYLARTPKPDGWQLVALRCAKALLEQPSVAHAEQAIAVAREVIYESSRGQGVGEARELERRALATLPAGRRTRFEHPELDELALQARELGEAAQGREAIAAADALIKRLHDDKPSAVACEAYIARGNGLAAVKRYSEASDEFGTAMARCEGQPRLVNALFLGARVALRGGRPAEARRRYAELEQRFPGHSYADDARLHGAEAALELGDEAAFTAMLSRIADDFPGGDMVDEGLFTLARARMDQGDWAGAVAPLERALGLQDRGRPYWAEGRPHYFLARAKLELGQRAEGIALLQRVIREFPFGYYAALAYARLHNLDAVLAEQTLTQGMAGEPSGNFVIPDSEALHRPAFLRAVALVRQGLGTLALGELDSLGVSAKSADPSVLWASAFLLARIEAPAESHGLLRGSPGTWSTHFPAGVWRPVWEVAYPRPYQAVVEAEAKRSGVPAHLIYAIMREESAFKPHAASSAGAYGLMQLVLATAKTMARPLSLPSSAAALKQPAVNIALGSRYLGVLMRRFPHNPLLAIPGYNAGPGHPEEWAAKGPSADFDLFVERMPFRETRLYTKRVMASMLAYAALYAEGMRSPLCEPPFEVEPADALPAPGAAAPAMGPTPTASAEPVVDPGEP